MIYKLSKQPLICDRIIKVEGKICNTWGVTIMKKALLLILSLTMCFCLSACGSSNNKTQPQKPNIDVPEEKPGTQTAENVIQGNDECGYITINMYHNVLRAGTNGSGVVQIYATDSRSLIQWEILKFTEENPDFL